MQTENLDSNQSNTHPESGHQDSLTVREAFAVGERWAKLLHGSLLNTLSRESVEQGIVSVNGLFGILKIKNADYTEVSQTVDLWSEPIPELFTEMFPAMLTGEHLVCQWLYASLGIEEYVCEFVRMGVEAIGSQADSTGAQQTNQIVSDHLRTYSGTAYEATQFGTAILAPIEGEMLQILKISEPSTDLAIHERRVKEFINRAALQVVLRDEKFDLGDPGLVQAIPLVIGKLTEQIKSTSLGKDNQALIVPIEPTIWNLFDLAKMKYLAEREFGMQYSNAIDRVTQSLEMTISLDKIRSNVLTRTLAKLSGFAVGLIYSLNIDAAYAFSEEGGRVKSTAGLKTILTALTGGLGIAVCLGGFLATAPPAIYEQLNPLNTAALRLFTTAGVLTFLGISLRHWDQRYSFKRYVIPHEIIHLLAGAREKERRARIAPPISTD